MGLIIRSTSLKHLSNVSRWFNIQSIFETSRALQGDQRSQYLEHSCGNDATLRAEVESLLHYSVIKDQKLEKMVGKAAGVVLGSDHPESPGWHIGPYRIIRELGQGGMGSVFLAERSDRQYQKQVAIKMLRGSLTRIDIHRRFLADRQILANLEHPHIARLFDGGTTEQGLPYLVLEYAEGLPIDAYCEQNRLCIKRRIQLFRQVCGTVAYAHQKLIIHRDLKPSNIIITTRGEPKLLDFGIAKIFSSTQHGLGVLNTETHQCIYTPEYASPEQVRGDAISTASDVYSLGVLLYQLLTGSRPYRIDIARAAKFEKVICEIPPPRPSRMVTEPVSQSIETASVVETAGDSLPKQHRRKLYRQLRGELDNIVLKALEKDPKRRYSSVEQFSDDLCRFLNHQPVQAHRNTWWYRSLRFLQRNRLAVLMTTTLFTAISALALITLIHALRIGDERDKATLAHLQTQHKGAKLAAINGFLKNMLTSVDTIVAQGKEITVRELLEQTSNHLRSDNILSDQADIEAAFHLTLGRTYHALGIYKKAESELIESVRLYTSMLGEQHEDTLKARLHLAETYYMSVQYPQTQNLVGDLREICKEHFPVHNVSCLQVGSLLARALIEKQDFQKAEKILLKQLQIARNHFGNSHSLTLNLIADVILLYSWLDQFEKAEPLFEEYFNSINLCWVLLLQIPLLC